MSHSFADDHAAVRDRCSLTDLELASGIPLGGGAAPRVSFEAGGPCARQALEAAIEDLLRTRAPVVVAFSGGLDSSTVLAVASAVARREALPPPVTVTLRFPDAPATREDTWQELVINHARVEDWIRIDLGDELDVIGPYAAAGLESYGIRWPSNAHLMAPIIERVPGATVVTGVDGDGLLSAWRWQRASAWLARPWTMRPRDVRHLALAIAPARVRRAVLRRRMPSPPPPPWLLPRARSSYLRALLEDAASEPLAWSARVEWYARRRYFEHFQSTLGIAADAFGGRTVQPLLDSAFLAAVAREGGRRGFGGRARALASIAGDLLPRELFERSDKAVFTDVFWSGRSRAFARQWDGGGVPCGLVDPGRLRDEWLSERPDFRSASLLQNAWLAREVRTGAAEPHADATAAPRDRDAAVSRASAPSRSAR